MQENPVNDRGELLTVQHTKEELEQGLRDLEARRLQAHITTPLPSVGRIVHYVLESGRSQGQHRPAIIVRDWQQENGLVQLQVFTDGINDDFKETHLVRIGEQDAAIVIHQNSIWRTSVHYNENKEPGTWHWPE